VSAKLSKETAHLVKVAKGHGFTWDGRLTGKGHLKLRHRNGTLTLSGTPGAYTARRNALTRMKRIARDGK
jgi:hypothetical protein